MPGLWAIILSPSPYRGLSMGFLDFLHHDVWIPRARVSWRKCVTFSYAILKTHSGISLNSSGPDSHQGPSVSREKCIHFTSWWDSGTVIEEIWVGRYRWIHLFVKYNLYAIVLNLSPGSTYFLFSQKYIWVFCLLVQQGCFLLFTLQVFMELEGI